MKRRFIIILSVLILIMSIDVTAWKGNVFSRADISEKRIALTFDDGPHSKYTDEILDILSEYGIKATFFIIGENVTNYPQIVEREIKEGHEIGNHTMNHTSLMNADEALIKTEVSALDDLLLEKFEYKTKLLRPPGGQYNENVCDFAEKNGYTVVLWDVDTRDWAHPTVNEICENIKNNIKDGSIILCHDFIGGKMSPTPMVLRKILPDLISEGYEFVTVSELRNE